MIIYFSSKHQIIFVGLMTYQSNNLSENLIHEWLVAIIKDDGGTKDDVEFVGDRNKGVPGKRQSPPDFVLTYKDQKIAVEVTLLEPGGTHKKWITAEKSMEKKLNKLTREIASDNGTCPWYFVCEYDPNYPPPPGRFEDIKPQAMKAFREGEPLSEHQLLPDKKKGYGIELKLVHRVKKDGTPGEVTSCFGILLEDQLENRLSDVIRSKEEKITDEVKKEYDGHLWWLVLDDRILLANKSFLHDKEVENIVQHVGKLINRDLWDKVVFVSRWRRVWAIWENLCTAELPIDPVWQGIGDYIRD